MPEYILNSKIGSGDGFAGTVPSLASRGMGIAMEERKTVHRTFIEDAVTSYLDNGGVIMPPLFPVISDRASWEGLDPELKSDLVNAGAKAAKEPWPQLLVTDYLDFNRTGNRVRFEDKFFARRIKLTNLVIAECVENKGRFLDDILNGLYLILEESSWCLPAHNTHVRDGEKLPLPDTEHPIVDLFAAETGALVGLASYLLHPVFNKTDGMLAQYIERELRRRIVLPYLTEHYWWMGDGVTRMMNWTPWITQNVLIAVSCMRECCSREEKTKIVQMAAFSADCFADSYGEDGCCEEGAQYYSHAGLCLFGCLDILSRITGGAVSDCFMEPVVRNMAAYIVRMYVGDGYYINFADCSAYPGRRSAREYLFGKATKNPAMAAFAAADYRSQSREERLLPAEQNLYYHVLQAFAHREMMAEPAEGGGAALTGDFWFESTGLMTARDERFVLAAKGGNNAEAHNHNDVGSVILYQDAKPVLIDLGVETYTRKTFSEQRYEIWTMQSQYHNLPSFEAEGDFIQQKDGAEYRAAGVQCSISEEEASLCMELAGAYDHPAVESYVRTVTLKKGRGVSICDRYRGTAACTLSLMTYETPEILPLNKDEGQYLIRISSFSKAIVSGAADMRIEECPVDDARLGIVWKHSCHRILIRMAEDCLKIELEPVCRTMPY